MTEETVKSSVSLNTDAQSEVLPTGDEATVVATGGGAVVKGNVNTGGGDFVRRDKIVYTRSPEEELSDYLAQAVPTFAAQVFGLGIDHPPEPTHPYKFLYPFEMEDTDIFFGRDAAIENLRRIILKDRLTVLHARSGAGKTSLLKAGVSPCLIRQRRLPVHTRTYEDPVLSIKRAIAPPSLAPWPERLKYLSLHEFLGQVSAHLGQLAKELVIVLDQFEEFFVYWPEESQRQSFVNQLADCYDDQALNVRFAISIRSDYFSYLASFQSGLPHIFHNEYYLAPMTREEALEAITGPVRHLGRHITYEQPLLDALLEDLVHGGMELPHLQVVCTRLYDTLTKGQTAITLGAYEKLGRVEGVLGEYLRRVLKQMSGSDRTTAEAVLKALTSSEGTRRALSRDALVEQTDSQPKELGKVLKRLVTARLLHRDETVAGIVYELAHDSLITEIMAWVRPSDLALKQVEELIEREVAHWRTHGWLIPKERLELIYEQRAGLKSLRREALECILRSALEHEFKVDYWVRLAGDSGSDILLETLGDAQPEIRRRATQGLGTLWEVQEVRELAAEETQVRSEAVAALGRLKDVRTIAPLLAALQDEDGGIRQSAAMTLGELGDPQAVEGLLQAVAHEDSYTRRAVVEALGELGDPRAFETLVLALKEENSFVRRAAAESLAQTNPQEAIEPLIAAMGDRNPHVRQAVARALGEIGDRKALQALMDALEDESFLVRRASIEALGMIHDKRAVDPLIAALAHEDSYTRRSAATALGQITRKKKAVAALDTALQDEMDYVRKAAAEALRHIGTTEALAALERQGIQIDE